MGGYEELTCNDIKVTPKGVQLLTTMVALDSFDMLEPNEKPFASSLFRLRMFQPIDQEDLDELIKNGYLVVDKQKVKVGIS